MPIYFHDDGCYMPGFDQGPDHTGGEPVGYVCEDEDAHEGPHFYQFEDEEPVFWPVAEGLVN